MKGALPWTGVEEMQLRLLAMIGLKPRECALVMARTAKAISSYAARNRIAFYSQPNDDLRRHLDRGGFVVREDVGGAVGTNWARACRSGPGFSAACCEAFLEAGLMIRDAGSGHYRAPGEWQG